MKRILLIFLTAFVLLLGAAPAEAEELSFDEIYSAYSADGLTFSDKTLSLEGGTVTVSGYMAPPLTPTGLITLSLSKLMIPSPHSPMTRPSPLQALWK